MYRLYVDNQSGAAVTPTCQITPWKFDSNGEKTEETTVTPTFSSIADNPTYDAGKSTDVDNSTVKAIGAHVLVTFPATVSATGDAYVYLQQSPDGGTTWANVLSNPIGTVTDFTAEKRVEAEV